jgi:hypothetical protein
MCCFTANATLRLSVMSKCEHANMRMTGNGNTWRRCFQATLFLMRLLLLVPAVAAFLRGTVHATVETIHDEEEWPDLDMGHAPRFRMCAAGEIKYYQEAPGMHCSETCLPEHLYMAEQGLKRATSPDPCAELGYAIYWTTTMSQFVSILPPFDTYVLLPNKV